MHTFLGHSLIWGGRGREGGAGDTSLGSIQAMATQKYTCKGWNSDAPPKSQPMKHLARSLYATASFYILTAATAATTTQKNFGYWHCCCFFPPLRTFSCDQHTHTHCPSCACRNLKRFRGSRNGGIEGKNPPFRQGKTRRGGLAGVISGLV